MNVHASLTSAAAARSPTSVEVLRGLDAFEALKPEWDRLFRRAAKPHQLFQSHPMLSAWAKSYPEAGDVIVITAREHGALVAALPLVMRTNLGVKRLHFMGMPVVQFGDMLVDPHCDSDTAAKIWAAIPDLGADVLEARRIRADAELWPFRDNATVVETMAAPFACLLTRVDGDAPGPAYSGRDKSNLRRRMRRLEERGKVELTTQGHGPAAADLAARAVDMKRRSLHAAGVLSPAVKARGFETFFRNVANDPECGLIVSTVELDGQPVAIDLSFLCKDTAFGHVLATEPAFHKEGAGNILVHHVFASAKAAGATTFDLLAPADAYKMHHADGETAVESRVYPFTMRGRLFANAFHRLALPAAKALLR